MFNLYICVARLLLAVIFYPSCERYCLYSGEAALDKSAGHVAIRAKHNNMLSAFIILTSQVETLSLRGTSLR